jgi:hypothetical protein
MEFVYMDKRTINAVNSVVSQLLKNECKRTTKFLSPNLVVAAQRIAYKNKIDKRGNIDIRLKIGKPNYLERVFIKQCKKAGEPFPIKNVQLKFFPVKKKAKK